jgi:hypothetical protein
LPSSVTTYTPKAVTLPSARAAPGTSESRSTTSAGTVSEDVAMAPALPSPGRTTTSPTVDAKSAVKLRSRVSVKIRVPLTKATPSTIANVLINSRSLRPSRLFSAALITWRPSGS